jgi:hypothetical protein
MSDQTKERCPHENFAAKVDCNRLTGEGGKVTGYSADVRINCNDCGLPFEFVGVSAGFSPKQPMCDVSAQELRAPIRPKGCNIMPGIFGYEVKAQ